MIRTIRGRGDALAAKEGGGPRVIRTIRVHGYALAMKDGGAGA